VERPRVAIVHERFTELGGSERVVEQLVKMWPEATVYTTVVDRSALPSGLRDADIRPSSLQHLYRGGTSYAHLLPFFPSAIRRIDVEDADLVVASHHAFSNWVKVPSRSRFISYVHTPARWMWDRTMRAFEGGLAARASLGTFAALWRSSDRSAAQRPDEILANSENVARRVGEWWGRRAEVVYPPVDVERFCPDGSVAREQFFLLAGRLVPYKRPEVAVAAAERAGARLVVAGTGRSSEVVRRAAGPRTELLGAVSSSELLDLFRRCRALVFPGEEDFGMVPVEAQACGAPVIALKAGGARESVVDGVTGVAYEPGDDEVGALAAILEGFDPRGFDPDAIRAHAERFSCEVFSQKVSDAAHRLLGER
jgi:glycosyltransferase involved in cell wall biosynthesis